MQRHEYIHKSLHQIFVNNFIGGIAWGLGATVGVSLIVALFGIILAKIDFIPIIGDIVLKIMDFVGKNQTYYR